MVRGQLRDKVAEYRNAVAAAENKTNSPDDAEAAAGVIELAVAERRLSAAERDYALHASRRSALNRDGIEAAHPSRRTEAHPRGDDLGNKSIPGSINLTGGGKGFFGFGTGDVAECPRWLWPLMAAAVATGKPRRP